MSPADDGRDRASAAIVDWLRKPPSILDDEDQAVLLAAADRIEYLESLAAADEWTMRNVLDELEAGKVYDAENAIRIALLTHQNGSTESQP